MCVSVSVSVCWCGCVRRDAFILNRHLIMPHHAHERLRFADTHIHIHLYICTYIHTYTYIHITNLQYPSPITAHIVQGPLGGAFNLRLLEWLLAGREIVCKNILIELSPRFLRCQLPIKMQLTGQWA